MNLDQQLNQFQPIQFNDQTEGLNTEAADHLLKLLTRLTKLQMKSVLSHDLTKDEVLKFFNEYREKMDLHEDFISSLQEQKNLLSQKLEQSIRLILELTDIIVNFEKSAMKAKNIELHPIAQTMRTAMEMHLQKAGWLRIPAEGDIPDGVYHFVLAVKEVDDPNLKGRILEVIREGYRLDGKVIRKADVIVGK